MRDDYDDRLDRAVWLGDEMGHLLEKIGLRVQIGLIGLIGVVIIIAVAVLVYSSILHQEQIQRAMDEASAANDLSDQIDIGMLQARRHEKDFFLRSDEKYAREQQASAEKVGKAIDGLIGLLKQSDEISLAQSVKTDVGRYAQQFNEVVALDVNLGLNENAGVLGRMRSAVHAIEEALKGQNDPKLEILMLTLRRHEKDFLARKDPKYAELLKKAVEEFAVAVKTAAISDEMRTDIQAKMTIYRDSFLDVVRVTAAVAEASKKMSDIYAGVEPVLLSIIKLTNDRYETGKAEIAAAREHMMNFIVIVLGAGILILVIAAAFISRAVCLPLIDLTEVMRRLAAGNHDLEITHCGARNEIGEMSRAVQVFKENAIEKLRLASLEEQEREAKYRREQESEELIDMFSASVSGVFTNLSRASTDMSDTAKEMQAVASHTNTKIDLVTREVAEARSNSQAVAAASQELTAAIGEISRLVNTSSKIAEAGSTQAKDVIQQVTMLRDASDKIDAIIGIISEIASQTNLLALNATIEAARAGDAGKGFAVVAGEVKNLSQQTQKATVEIDNQIKGIQSAIGGTVQAVQEIGQTVTEIHQSSTEIAAAITEQQSATDEIARNIQFISGSTDRISESMESVRESADRTNVASNKVNGASISMANQTDRMSSEVKDFLSAIKGSGSTHNFERLDADISAAVVSSGRSQVACAKQLSIAGVWLDLRLDQPLGSSVEVTLQGVARPIHARVAGQTDRGTRLQFPMDAAHLAFMTDAVSKLRRKSA